MSEEIEKDSVGHAVPPPKEFRAIPPALLNEYWPLVKADLSKIDNPEETPPEEVYYMLKSNQATLFILYMEAKYVGFVVARAIPPDLHLWLVYATNGYDCLRVFRPEVMHIARQCGAKSVTFGSRRKAWQEVSKEHGFSVRAINYFCPVDGVQTAS